MEVLVLSSTWHPLRTDTWESVISDVIGGRMEVLRTYDSAVIRTVSEIIPMPSVARMVSGGYRLRLRTRARPTRTCIWSRDGGTCQYCGVVTPRSAFTVDHVVPESRGGPWSWSNLVTACGRCNNAKDCRTPAEAGMHLLSTPTRSPGTLLPCWDSDMPDAWRQFLHQQKQP